MLEDSRIRELVDYPVSSDVFPGVEVKGGVCFFLRDTSYKGECRVTTVRNNEKIGPSLRKLNEYDVFVRDSRALSILRKVISQNEPSVNTLLARDKEFGWTSNFSDFSEKKGTSHIPLYYVRSGKRKIGYVTRKDVLKSQHLIDYWKVLVPEAGSDGGQKIPDVVLGKPLIAPSPSVCTQSFLFFYVNSKDEAISLQSYYASRFFRFLVSLRKITQHATHSTYTWVPLQSWDRVWGDNELYKKYNLNSDEIGYIEYMIKPMDVVSGEEDD